MAKLNNNIYNRFASDYDSFMIPMPYDEWAAYVLKLLKIHDIRERRILDVACGTGSFLVKLAKKGCIVNGLDSSEKMIRKAREKTALSGIKARFFKGRMEDFKLKPKFPIITCLFDSVNYLINISLLRSFFKNVYHALLAGGIFIFDMNTVYGLENGWGNKIVINKNRNITAICSHHYFKKNKLAKVEISVFSKKKNSLYTNYSETHWEKGYNTSQLEKMLKSCGFNMVYKYHDRSMMKPKKSTNRVWFVAVK